MTVLMQALLETSTAKSPQPIVSYGSTCFYCTRHRSTLRGTGLPQPLPHAPCIYTTSIQTLQSKKVRILFRTYSGSLLRNHLKSSSVTPKSSPSCLRFPYVNEDNLHLSSCDGVLHLHFVSLALMRFFKSFSACASFLWHSEHTKSFRSRKLWLLSCL